MLFHRRYVDEGTQGERYFTTSNVSREGGGDTVRELGRTGRYAGNGEAAMALVMFETQNENHTRRQDAEQDVGYGPR